MKERLTWVGIDERGVVQYLAADPAYEHPSLPRAPRPDRERCRKDGEMYSAWEDVDWLEQELENYQSLVDYLRYYASVGRVLVVTDDQLPKYSESMSEGRPVES